MTLPTERSRAVLNTMTFLGNLIDPKVTPGLPKRIREQAKSLLRHYPTQSDIMLTHNGWGDKMVGFVIQCPFGDPTKPF